MVLSILVSDMNHHVHPIAWGLDSFRGGSKIKSECYMRLVDEGSYEEMGLDSNRNSYISVKDWIRILKGEPKRGMARPKGRRKK